MMKFFRKHKKAVSPVIAVMLLVAVAVAAVGAYFIWFRSFQSQTQGAVQQEASGALGTGMQIVSLTNDGTSYYIVLRNTSNKYFDVTAASIGGITATTTIAATGGGADSIAPNESKSFVIAVTATPAYKTERGTTRTFTILYNVFASAAELTAGTPVESTGAFVHTYTDA